MSQVAVVILNWNGIGYLKRFLPSVVEYTNPEMADIYVADNGSTDESIAWLRKNYEQVQIIMLNRNYGFAGGYNLSLKQISCRYYVLLNSDVEVTAHWLDPLVKLMDSDPAVAACMPKIKSAAAPSLFEYAGAAGGYIDKWGYPFCRGRILHHIEPDEGQYDSSVEIFWASGACLLIRSDLFFKAGGLDSFFFAHMEEIDLCWRLKNLGYRIRFVHEAQVFHLGGGTLPKKNHRKTYLNFRNNIILLVKNLPAKKLAGVLVVRFVLDFVAAAFFLIKLDPGESFAVVKAYFSLLFHTRKIFRLRKEHRVKDCPLHQNEIFNGSIVWNFYIRRKKTFNLLGF